MKQVSSFPGYTDDVAIGFGDMHEIWGKNEAEKVIRARFARIKDYKLQKTLRAVMGNVVGVYWDGAWEYLKTGKLMNVRGTESRTLRGGQVVDWEATVKGGTVLKRESRTVSLPKIGAFPAHYVALRALSV